MRFFRDFSVISNPDETCAAGITAGLTYKCGGNYICVDTHWDAHSAWGTHFGRR